MLLKASYEELNRIIHEMTQLKGLSLNYCDSDTTKVSFMLNILGLNPSISAKVKVVSIDGCRITVGIDAGKVGDFVLDKARKFIMEKTPEGLLESFDDKLAVVNLEAIPDLKPVFEALTVNDVSFTEDNICLDASLIGRKYEAPVRSANT